MTKQWVKLYAQTYLAKDVTYYMHVMAMHMPQSMSVHGSLSGFSQQTFEKMNDQLKSLYFKASDHKLGNLQAFEQIIQKMNRIAYLLPTCQRKHLIYTCSECGKKGHNTRSCTGL